MPRVLEEAIDSVRALDRSEQERAARVLIAWLNGSAELERVDA